MNSACRCVIAVAALLCVPDVSSGQDVSRYRDYVLGSSVESVLAASGLRPAAAETIHERPAKIQQLEWRAPYVGVSADPVSDIEFSFYNDALYQVIVRYNRDRTEGLTSNDIVDTLTTTYGAPLVRSAKTPATRPAVAHPDAIVVAQWQTTEASLSLVRDTYSPEFQLILISKPLSLSARNATREAIRLDAAEAPRREMEERRKEAEKASAERDKARTANKAGFRP